MDKRRQNVIKGILVAVIAVLAIALLLNYSHFAGTARVINRAGYVRGGTQLLVKEELAGHADPALLSRLDSIMYDLRTGRGRYGIKHLSCDDYNSKLEKQSDYWISIKKEIAAVRNGDADGKKLYAMSNRYFVMADETVKAAEVYTEKITARLRVYEVLMFIDMALLVLLFFFEIKNYLVMTSHNRELNAMAYTDQNTGLPNSRKCDERLADKTPVPADISIVCFMFDLNNLKQTNDRHGHEAGDVLLTDFAQALTNAAAEHMFIGRRSGDEFIAVQVGMDKPGIEGFLQRLKEEARTVSSAEGHFQLSYAQGYAASGDNPGLNIGQLMHEADLKMYADKMQYKERQKASRIGP